MSLPGAMHCSDELVVLEVGLEAAVPETYTPASAGSLPVCSTTESPARTAIFSMSSSETASTCPRMILLIVGWGMARRFAATTWVSPSRLTWRAICKARSLRRA